MDSNIKHFSLKKKVHFEFPVSLVPYLFYHLDKNLRFLMTHLKKRQKLAHKVKLQILCDHTESYYQLEVHPQTPHNSAESFLHLLESQLGQTPPEGLISEILIEVIPYDKDIHKNRYKKAYVHINEERAPVWVEEDLRHVKNQWKHQLLSCI